MTTPLASFPIAPTAPLPPAPDAAPTALARLRRELGVWAALGVITLPLTVWAGVWLGGRVGFVGFVAAYLAGGALLRAGMALSWAAGARATLAVLWPSGESTRRVYAFSREQALVTQGDAAGAVDAYECRLAEVPGDVGARLRLAELYVAQGEPRRAAELLRDLRRLPGVTAEQDVAASNRLVDLYVGPLGEPGRALGELRRLSDRYPDTRLGAEARAALARLKSA